MTCSTTNIQESDVWFEMEKYPRNIPTLSCLPLLDTPISQKCSSLRITSETHNHSFQCRSSYDLSRARTRRTCQCFQQCQPNLLAILPMSLISTLKSWSTSQHGSHLGWPGLLPKAFAALPMSLMSTLKSISSPV